MKPEILSFVLDARSAKRPVALATDLQDGRQRAWSGGESVGDLDSSPDIEAAIAAALQEDRARVAEIGDRRIFVQPENPPLRLVIVGAVHIAQALAPMAALSGYAVTVVDPRRAFAGGERFAGIETSDDWPDEALERIAPDRRTAVVTLTHDPKLDDPALQVALRSSAFYVAALGSTRTHARRLDRLREAGFDDAALSRIHGPAGLRIGAVSPAEIAISVMAEMTSVLRGEEAS